MAPFLTLAYLYEETGDRTCCLVSTPGPSGRCARMPRTPHGGMQHIRSAEENHHQLWDDTLMMTVLPLAKIGLLLDRPHTSRRPPSSSSPTSRT